jgi:hypothetical protein
VAEPFSSSSIWFARQVARRPSPGVIVLQKNLTSALQSFVVSTSPSPLHVAERRASQVSGGQSM